MAAGGSSDQIRVVVRLRKLLRREVGAPIFWQTDEKANNEIRSQDGSKKFLFDRVFSASEDNEVVFKDIGLETIDSAMRGVHSTIFAYGQTGSGNFLNFVCLNFLNAVGGLSNEQFSICKDGEIRG